MWCLDGMRLAVSDDADLSVTSRFVVPVKALEHLKAFGNGSMEITVEKKYAAFSGGGLTLACRQLEADDDMKIETDGGCEIPYVFELKYMKETLEQFAGEKYLRINVSGETTPLVLSAGGAIKDRACF